MSAASMSLVGTHEPALTPPEKGYRQLMHRVQSEYREMPGLCLSSIRPAGCGHSIGTPVAASGRLS